MSTSEWEMSVDLGTSGSAPAHDLLTRMLQTAQKSAPKIVRLQWNGQQDNCKFYLQAQMTHQSGSVPEWTFRRLADEDLMALSKHMRGENHIFQMVTGDVGLLSDLIWSECTGTNPEMDPARQTKAFDGLNNSKLRDIRMEYNPAAFGSSGFPSSSSPFDTGAFTTRRVSQQAAKPSQAELQAVSQASVTLAGDLSEVELTGVLQSIKICDMVGRLDIQDKLIHVEIFFEDGEVVHAVNTNALAGAAHQSVVGDRVVLDVLTWDRGLFTFNKARKTSERSIKRRLEGLLLEGSSLRDYRRYLQEAGIDEDTVLELTQQISIDEAQRVLEDGVNMDMAKQVQFYSAIDGKATLGQIVQQLSMFRTTWLPIVFNLLSCHLAAPIDRNKTALAGNTRSMVTIRQKSVQVAARELLRPDTGMHSFPLFMHFLNLEGARYAKQKSIFSVVLFDFKKGTEPASQTALQQMAQCFDSVKDDFHMLGHFGDLDFAILLPLQNAAESKVLLGNFAAKLSQTKLHGFSKMQDLHLVFGVADTVNAESTVSQLLQDADQARLEAIRQKVTCKTITECRWERLKGKAGGLGAEDYQGMKAIWLEALIEARRIGGKESQLNVTLDALANVFMKLGEFDEAEPCLLELLQLKKYAFGPADKSVLKTGNALVECYTKQEKLDEAERLQQDIVRSYVLAAGADNPEAPGVAYALVTLYRGRKDYKNASVACKTVLDMSTAIFGEADPKTARVKKAYDDLCALAAK